MLGRFTITLPRPLVSQVLEAARQQGVPVRQWLREAVELALVRGGTR